jgi:hypothetical protein
MTKPHKTKATKGGSMKVGQVAGAPHVWIEVKGTTETLNEKQLTQLIAKLQKAKKNFKKTAKKTPRY